MSNLRISTRVRRLFHYLGDFEKGIIRIPAFQRDFEWDRRKKIKFFDSIKEGYPIGSILFWQPDAPLNLKFKTNKIGAYYLPPERPTDYTYILDGYQRLATLFGCLVNPDKTTLARDVAEWKRDFNLIYNLESNEIESITNDKYKIYEIPIYKFVDAEAFYDFQTELVRLNVDRKKAHLYKERYKTFGVKLSSYEIPCMDIMGGNIKQVVEIFTRLNSEGAKMTLEWILSALSYDASREFVLSNEINDLLIELSKYNFGNLSRNVILQCILNAFGLLFFDETEQDAIAIFEKLAQRDDFIAITRHTIQMIETAVLFLYYKCSVLDIQLLPSEYQLIFITNFFYETDPLKRAAEPEWERNLLKWFWVTTYCDSFAKWDLKKRALAYKTFHAFIVLGTQNLIDYFKETTSDLFEISEFPKTELALKISMGNARAKALALFMLHHQMVTRNERGDYDTFSLFRDENKTENMIFWIGRNLFSQLQKDASILLELEPDYSAFFITTELKMDFKNKVSQKVILEKRKKLIVEAEQNFVEKWGLKYNSPLTTENTTMEMPKIKIFNFISILQQQLSKNGIGQLSQWKDNYSGYISLTNYYSFGKPLNGMQNNLAYYLESDNIEYVRKLKLVLNINHKVEKPSALRFYAEMVEKTFKSIQITIPNGLFAACVAGKVFKSEQNTFTVTSQLTQTKIDTWELLILSK
jgi:Protein of unknown function DUF262